MLDFSGYTRKKIQADMLAKIPNTIDKREGSIIQTAIGPVAWFLEGVFMTLDQLQQNANATTAVGASLDEIAKSRGITRKAAKPAVRQGVFNLAIPSGSQFKTINGVNSLIFTSGAQISVSDGSYVYELTCNTAGEAGNNYTGALLPITAINGLTSANIGVIVTPGTDEETDDALRTRYFATFAIEATGGNIAAYRTAILAINGVGAVQVYPAWNGGGTVLCSILGSDYTPALPALVESVQEAICPLGSDGLPSSDGFGMANIGAAVTITTATPVTLDIVCDIEFVSSVTNGVETYQSQIEETIQNYITSVNATWGDPVQSYTISYPLTVYRSRIINAILQIEDIVNVTNVTINGTEADFVFTETPQFQQVAELGTVVINGE